MYRGHKNTISTKQLENQVALLQETKAKRQASLALDLNPDFPSYVYGEIGERVHFALWTIDTKCLEQDYLNQKDDEAGLRHGF